MKEGIHPEYKPAKITCVCGNVIETRSTRGDFEVEVCSNCHPFFTGKQKYVDTAGRVERFQRRYGDYAGRRTSEPEEPAEEPAGTEPSGAEDATAEDTAEPAGEQDSAVAEDAEQ